MVNLDLIFPVRGSTIASDHAYALYGAISRIVPEIHEKEPKIRFAPITGGINTEGRLSITENSILRIRVADGLVRNVLPLAGKRMMIGNESLRLGTPSVSAIYPAPCLISRIVTFKNADAPLTFLAKTRERLAEMGIAGDAQLPILMSGTRAGEPKRRVVRIRDKAIVGYSLIVSDLDDEGSIRLQVSGLGGRTNIGCGFFLPLKATPK